MQDSEQDPTDAPTALNNPGNESNAVEKLAQWLSLSLSIPERAARALGALVGGGTLLLSNTFIPPALKSSDSYRFTLGMFQSFLVRDLAKMEHEGATIALGDDFVQRKLVGTSFEAAGLLTMQLSPVWVFAIASDTAKGGQVFLQRLVVQLRENDLISQDSYPSSLEQILVAIHDTSRQSAMALDTPPLNLEDARKLAADLRNAGAGFHGQAPELLPRFEKLWHRITEVSREQDMSIPQLMGILSVNAASAVENGRGAAGAVRQTGYALLDENILTQYNSTLSEISEMGAMEYTRSNMKPFLDSAIQHFNLRQANSSQIWFKTKLDLLATKFRT